MQGKFLYYVLIDIMHILFHVCLHGGKRMTITIPFPTSETIYKNANIFDYVMLQRPPLKTGAPAATWLLLTKTW